MASIYYKVGIKGLTYSCEAVFVSRKNIPGGWGFYGDIIYEVR